jgi:deoxyribodipyrimidine photolyase-related protein
MTTTTQLKSGIRNLVVGLGDQLDIASSAFIGFDPKLDVIWMGEVEEESTHVISAKQRIAFFLSAMRHFAQVLQAKEWPVIYTRLDSPQNTGSLAGELEKIILQKMSNDCLNVYLQLYS